MGFVYPRSMINQNSLGHSQSERFKKQKIIMIMTDNFIDFHYYCILIFVLYC